MVLDMDSTDATNIEALVRLALRTGDYSVVRGVFDRTEHEPERRVSLQQAMAAAQKELDEAHRMMDELKREVAMLAEDLKDTRAQRDALREWIDRDIKSN